MSLSSFAPPYQLTRQSHIHFHRNTVGLNRVAQSVTKRDSPQLGEKTITENETPTESESNSKSFLHAEENSLPSFQNQTTNKNRYAGFPRPCFPIAIEKGRIRRKTSHAKGYEVLSRSKHVERVKNLHRESVPEMSKKSKLKATRESLPCIVRDGNRKTEARCLVNETINASPNECRKLEDTSDRVLLSHPKPCTLCGNCKLL